MSGKTTFRDAVLYSTRLLAIQAHRRKNTATLAKKLSGWMNSGEYDRIRNEHVIEMALYRPLIDRFSGAYPKSGQFAELHGIKTPFIKGLRGVVIVVDYKDGNVSYSVKKSPNSVKLAQGHKYLFCVFNDSKKAVRKYSKSISGAHLPPVERKNWDRLWWEVNGEKIRQTAKGIYGRK